jgi:transcriptional regulator with XRE-family HTH domain
VNELVSRLTETLRDENGRYVYADTVTNAFVSAQIKALREDRALSQEDLAQLIGTKQSGISRVERADYSAWRIETLRKIARAFGVRLRIRFEEFGTLLDEVGGFTNKHLLPRRFEQDPVFTGSKRSDRRNHRRKARFSKSRKRVASKKPASREPYFSGGSSIGSNSTGVMPIPFIGSNQSGANYYGH